MKKQHRNPKRWKDIQTKTITFTARTFKALQMTYMALKQRYRRKVVLFMEPLGAGLFEDRFTVA